MKTCLVFLVGLNPCDTYLKVINQSRIIVLKFVFSRGYIYLNIIKLKKKQILD
jgi:hypothetical protein